ncbi:hypothetical protein Tco_1359559 [Tanacetum coccineum]
MFSINVSNASTSKRFRAKRKSNVLERESRARVDLLESQNIAEDMRVLTMDTSSLDPMNAAIDLIRSLNMITKDVVKFSLWWASDDLDC